MKSVIILVVVLAACVFAADNLPESVEAQLGLQHIHLSASAPASAVATDDQLIENLLQTKTARNFLENYIRDTLEGFRDTVVNGEPPLDPYLIDSIGPLVLSIAPGVRTTFNFKDIRAEGLRWYVVDDVSFNILRLNLGVQVTLPWLIVTGNYDARARILLVTHNAGGGFRVFVNRVVVSVGARLGTNLLGGHLLLRELNIDINIHDTNIQIQGMVGSSLLNSLINSIVQNVSQSVIQEQMDVVSQALSEALFDTINEVLKDYTLSDILG